MVEAAGADLGALKILKDTDGSLLAVSDFAETLDKPSVLFVGSVREIEASDIHACPHQLANHGFGVACGPEGADNLGASFCREVTAQWFIEEIEFLMFHPVEIPFYFLLATVACRSE
jgi:hypothetical protein